jgi:ubiquinol-cytochrome c reductase cytochrome c1 subunit
MPHVLWELQGLQRPVYEKDAAGHEAIVGFEPVMPGKLSPAEYDKAAADLTGFLVYMAEPVRTERERLGWWVLGFLLILLVVSYLLKKEYWRDVH